VDAVTASLSSTTETAAADSAANKQSRLEADRFFVGRRGWIPCRAGQTDAEAEKTVGQMTGERKIKKCPTPTPK
jgi:hypothetical protein